MPTLELKNISYAYEKGKAVLQNVSAELETGKLYAILGPSGSGKTTLLSLLGGLDVPTQGGVLFDGEDITAKGLEHHRRNNISLIFQSYNLIDYMTPVENVRLTAKLDAAPILERLGLEQDEITGMCRNCPADSNSGWRLRGRWLPMPRSFWRTSRPGTWTPTPPRKSRRF